MAYFTQIPIELLNIVGKYLTVKSIFWLNITTKSFYNAINQDINKYVYKTICSKNVYTETKRISDKSLWNYNTETSFQLQENEYVLANRTISTYNGNVLIVISINANFTYIIYEFEIPTISAFGIKASLERQMTYQNIKDINLLLKAYHMVILPTKCIDHIMRNSTSTCKVCIQLFKQKHGDVKKDLIQDILKN